MPYLDVQAAELQRQLAELIGHELTTVHPYGKHMLIQMNREGSVDTVARLSETGDGTYEAAFRSHTGRWEPLPGRGDLSEITALVVDLLAPYFGLET